MVKINSILSKEEFIKKIEESLGLSIDRSSFDVDVFETIRSVFLKSESSINNFLESLNFENRKGKSLDNFLNFFNVHRKVGSENDVYEIMIVNSLEEDLTINSQSVIRVGEDYYKVLKEVVLYAGSSKEIQATIDFNKAVNNPIVTRDGLLCLSLDSVSGYKNERNLTVGLKVKSVSRTPSSSESDFEYLERAKKILPLNGMLNNVIIERVISRDSRVKKLEFKNHNGFTEVFIIPNNIDEIDEVFSSASEVVEYFRCDKLVLRKPNVMSFEIEGVYPYIYNEAGYETIVEEINTGVRTAIASMTIEGLVRPLVVKNIIKKIIEDNSSNKSININTISFSIIYFTYKNYSVPIINMLAEEEFSLDPTELIIINKIT